MPRRRAGPVRIGTRSTWYARLTIPPKHRERAGKTRLIRSLGTSDHGLALRRYGAVYESLERELAALLRGDVLRERVDVFSQPAITEDGIDLSPVEKTELLLGVNNLDPNNAVHQDVFNAISSHTQLPITWDEALELWIKVRNRSRSRKLSKSSIYCTTKAVKLFRDYAQPHGVTKEIIRRWLADQEVIYSETTVAANFRLIKSVMQVLADEDKIDTNTFASITYTASTDHEDNRRSFTDDELRLVWKELPEVSYMVMMGLRAGEYASRLPKDIDGGMLIIDDQPKYQWRPKTLSSYRRVPIPDGFKLDQSPFLLGSRVGRYGKDLRKFISDPQVVVHSARHTFYSLSRRAGCDERLIEKITGHAKASGSRTAKGYGDTPDDVLAREIKPIWELVESIISAS